MGGRSSGRKGGGYAVLCIKKPDEDIKHREQDVVGQKQQESGGGEGVEPETNTQPYERSC